MNQILETEKIYVTPRLKKKKKFYKLNFFISVFLLCLIFSYYVYGEYDKYKSEEISKDILSGIAFESYKEPEEPKGTKEDPILIMVGDASVSASLEIVRYDESLQEEYLDENIGEYKAIAIIRIPKLELEYPILSRTTDELLKISPNKFWGPNPNDVGNFCIAGHNYRNSKLFSKIPELEIGDVIYLTDLSGKTIEYIVNSKYNVSPEDTSCTSQVTNGKREITLITCTNDSLERIIIKATEKLD